MTEPTPEQLWDLIPEAWTMTIKNAQGSKAVVLCNVEDFARAVLAKWGTQPAPADSVLEDAARESEYRRGYRHGYEQRDAEVRGALA